MSFSMEMESIKKELFDKAMRGEWDDVVRIYEHVPRAHLAKITRSGDTALHLAVSNCQEAIVDELVRQIISNSMVSMSGLEIQNDRGNTALHFAASMGNVRMCKLIAEVKPLLIGSRNNDSETPLFLAALRGKKDAFLCLNHICGGQDVSASYCGRGDGQTVLHCAISGEYFDLAFQIIHLYPELVNYVNEQGLSPLHILASKPFAFKSGSNLGLLDRIIYHCEIVDELKPADQIFIEEQRSEEQIPNYPETNRICVTFLHFLLRCTRILTGRAKNLADEEIPCSKEHDENPPTKDHKDPLSNEHKGKLFPANYITCFNFVQCVFKALWIILGHGYPITTRIRRQKEKNMWSVQVLNELLRYASLYEYDYAGTNPAGRPRLQDETNSCEIFSAELLETPSAYLANSFDEKGDEKTSKPEGNETAVLIAAKNGITEMVEIILQLFPVAIKDVTAENKSIILLAVEHRQPDVCKVLQEKKFLEFDSSVFQEMDSKGNTALHLAATLQETNPWPVPGAALQMQWEIKWFKFIKKFFPDDYRIRYNMEGKTPDDIFAETHKGLVQDSATWLNNISQACSVVAGLFVTVAFNTSVTIPGGARQETGTPYLENQPAFEFFAISSQVAFYSSVISVVMFLAILTSAYQTSDFDATLPWKLLLGLTTLYISIASTLTSFSSAHFFILKSKLKEAASPVYVAICVVVTLFAIVQFPLYFRLVWATFKRVPQRRGRRAFARYFSSE